MDQAIHEEISEIKKTLSKQDVHSAETSKDIEYIKESLQRIEAVFQQMVHEKKKEHEDFNSRIDVIENWKLQFVARFSVYASIALTLGAIVSQLLISWITGKL